MSFQLASKTDSDVTDLMSWGSSFQTDGLNESNVELQANDLRAKVTTAMREIACLLTISATEVWFRPRGVVSCKLVSTPWRSIYFLATTVRVCVCVRVC